ncbi:MAG: 50S ribosome-binding GTPase [Bacilli bacterium]|nr:50S ribosome-binding GTPase [Bacilli bacterium]MDD3995737.1 50S ribosome-binding GTPase [Bacilli bacterium]
MINKCLGCGIDLQNTDSDKDGYVESNKENKLCKRCFRLKNYGEYLNFNSNDFYLNINEILKDEKSTILHVVDILNLNNEEILGDRKKDSILVINKKDIIPRSNNENTLLENIKKIYPGYMNYIIISSKNNHNLDKLYDLLLKLKNNIYVVGYTNSGKSSLIKKLLKNYLNEEEELLTSYYPSTTLKNISFKLNDNLTLIDTPGIVKNGSILKRINLDEIKRVVIDNEIKPKIFQFNKKTIIKIDNYCVVECNSLGKNSIIIFASNRLNIEKQTNDVEGFCYEFKINNYKEIVISDLCVIRFGKETNIKVFIDKEVNVYERIKLT